MIEFFRDVLDGPLYIGTTILSIILIMAIIGFLMERKKLEKLVKSKVAVVTNQQKEVVPIPPVTMVGTPQAVPVVNQTVTAQQTMPITNQSVVTQQTVPITNQSVVTQQTVPVTNQTIVTPQPVSQVSAVTSPNVSQPSPVANPEASIGVGGTVNQSQSLEVASPVIVFEDPNLKKE